MLHKCSVLDCDQDASVEVILYDVYGDGSVFFKQDSTCPYLCEDHVIENEDSIKGERKPRVIVRYKYSNQYTAQGFTIYKPIE